MDAGPGLVVRFWGLDGIWRIFPLGAAWGIAFGGGLVIAELVSGEHGVLLFLGLAIFVGGLGCLPATYLCLRPVQLTGSSVVIPSGASRKAINLDSVSGVGLQCRAGPTGATAAWVLRVWDGDGVAHQVPCQFVEATRTRSGSIRRTRYRPGVLPVPHEDADVLARSRPGRIAIAVRQAATARQGPAGPLAAQANEKNLHFDAAQAQLFRAWWSPDGTMGRAVGLPDSTSPAATDPPPSRTRQRVRAVVVAVFGFMWSMVIAATVDSLGGNSQAALDRTEQNGLLQAAVIVAVVGILASVTVAVRVWRGSPKRARTRRG